MSQANKREERILSFKFIYHCLSNEDKKQEYFVDQNLSEIDSDLNELMKGLQEENEIKKVDFDLIWAKKLITNNIKNYNDHLAAIESSLKGWKLERLNKTDLSVLLMAIAELNSELGTPKKVIFNEAIDLAKIYGSAESGSFVNGLLDKVSK